MNINAGPLALALFAEVPVGSRISLSHTLGFRSTLIIAASADAGENEFSAEKTSVFCRGARSRLPTLDETACA